MERQKVLYVARTKTAKVIRPTSLKHPLPLPYSSHPETETEYAPLASVEPEFVVATRKAFDRNKSLRGQVRRPASMTNVLLSDQVSRTDSGTFRRESANRDHTPPRTYVKPRATNTNGNHTGNSHISDNHIENSHISRNQKLNKVRPGQFLSCGVLPSDSQSQADNDLTSYDHSLPFLPSQNVSADEDNRKWTNSSHGVRRMDKRTQRTNQHSFSTMTSRNNVFPAELNSFTKPPPPVAPKPKISTKPVAVADSKPGVAHSEHDSRNSKSNFCPAQYVDDNGYLASKENYIESSQSSQNNILGSTQRSTENVQIVCKPERHSSQSPDQLLMSTQTELHQEVTTKVDNSGRASNPTLPSEMIIPVKSMFQGRDPLPEMYRFSPSVNTTDIRPKTAHKPVPRASHISQFRNGPRKPLVAIDTSFNMPENSKEEQRVNARLTGQNTSERQFPSDSSCQIAQIIVPNRRQSMDQDFPGIPQLGSVPSENLDLFFPEAEFKNSWKRNSMRLATQGYTSMSDLTNSLECLADNQAEAVTNRSSPNELVNNAPIQTTGLSAEISFSNMGESENCDSVSVESKSELSRYHDVVYESDTETIRPATDHEPVNGNSSQEEPVILLQRSGITRLSYRMATSTSLTDISLLEESMGELPDNSNQVYVVVKNNKNRSSDASSRLRGVGEMKNSQINRVARHDTHATDVLTPEMLAPLGQEEQGNKLKRLSFTLATCSISDLTFPPYVNYDNTIFSLIPNSSANQRSSDTDSTIKSTGNGGYQTPDSPHQEGSSYSSGRHSSFGSVYSFRSLDTGRAKHSQDQSVFPDKQWSCYSTNHKDTQLPEAPHIAGDSSDSDGSASGDTTFYYTASSDTSFVTTNGDAFSCQHLSGTTHRSPTLSPSKQNKSLHTLRSPTLSPSEQNKSLHTLRSPTLSSSEQNKSLHTLRSPTLSPSEQKSLHTLRSPTLSPSEQKNLHTLPRQDQILPRSPSRNQRPVNKTPQDRWLPRLPANGRKSPRVSSRDQRSPSLLSQGQRSQNLPVEDQKQEFFNCHRQGFSNPNLDSSNTTNSLTFNQTAIKRSSPVNNTLQCYSNSLSDGHSVPNPLTRNNSSKKTSIVNRTVEKNERSIDDLRGNNSNYSTEYVHVRYSDGSQRHLPVQALALKETDMMSTASLASSSSFCSLDSSEQEFPWEETPRFPPSLGKPRRKLYAGFDSQPLPMGSFISDSSSMYSVETCGSWGASRSAEVESCSRAVHMPPNIRAVSSIVSSTCAPVRCISQEEMLDLFRYADKALSVGDNRHNIYVNNRFKENCYDKTFSSESLKSVRSNDTIVGVDHQERAEDHTLECRKCNMNAAEPGMYNNACINWHEKTRNERRQLEKLNNSCGLDFGSRISNNTYVGGNVNNKVQLKTIKGKKYGQPFCMCRQSSLERFTAADGSVSVVIRDTGQWDISL